MEKSSLKLNAKEISFVGLMTAALCILGGFSVPIGPVPVSLTNFVIYVFAIVIGRKLSTLSTILYVLIGFVGLPVFSGFSGGAAKLFGPTGGYIIGFILVAYITGFASDNFIKNKIFMFLLMLLGTILLYILGTLWLSFQADMSFIKALYVGVIPFVFADLIKILVGMVIGTSIKKQLKINF